MGFLDNIGVARLVKDLKDDYDAKLDDKLDVDDYRQGMTWGELEGSYTWGDLEGDLSSAGTTYTQNYNLTKPGLNADVGISDINANMDSIDSILKQLSNRIQAIENASS